MMEHVKDILLRVVPQRGGRMQHQFYKCPPNCEDDHCRYCRGGLLLCTVCGQAEGDLTVECEGDRMWTDEALLVLEHGYRESLVGLNGGTHTYVQRSAELYRLARLGLAAEQVGRDALSAAETFEECANSEAMPLLKSFLNHTAWRK